MTPHLRLNLQKIPSESQLAVKTISHIFTTDKYYFASRITENFSSHENYFRVFLYTLHLFQLTLHGLATGLPGDAAGFQLITAGLPWDLPGRTLNHYVASYHKYGNITNYDMTN